MLTHTRAKAIKEAGRYGDGGGLYLVVSKTGSKSWVLRAMRDAKRRDMGLGGFPRVGLADARKKAGAYLEALDAGRDPVAERRGAAVPSTPTFGEVCQLVHDANSQWSKVHADSWLTSLKRHAGPIWERPVDSIDRRDVLAVLTPMFAEIAETGRRVRARIRDVMRFAVAHEWRDDNPAGEGINGALPKTRKGQRHHNAIDYREAASAVAAIGMCGAVRLCLLFAILTAARPGEARGARWSEIDLDARLWTIPAERMKTRTAQHRVPLSRPALAVLVAARVLDDGSDLVFPSPMKPGNPVTDMALLRVLRVEGLADRATVHGFRSTFRDWAAETTAASWEAMELSLAHAPGSHVERAYARTDLLEQRRELMEAWGEYLTG